ncbi:hypothetical protein KQY10_20260 [Leptospira interrogans]|nr:hypothetical protein [Leptospira interrogans]MCD1167881.1 hypothetical protein [Leptospira interrogans]MCH1894204.1 hypothetical protein [Leptospira interrogans]MCH1904339.1 hypothetical protein [Leptospira interrogans]QEI01446.1 hypothetical protein FWJ33_20070 [Leptospira interrogans serovar Hardjo]USM79489.1 hypothetical protein MY479_20020 [Leptospira interrogans]
MNFQKLIRSFYRMLFSNELILDDKKMRKNIYGSGWERHIELVPKPSNARTTTFLNDEKNHPKS